MRQFVAGAADLLPGHDEWVRIESAVDPAHLSERLRIRTLTDTY